MIKVGDHLPKGALRIKEADGKARKVDVDEIFKGKRVVLVGVPAAFSSTCHNAHAPAYVANADEIKAKGVDRIAIMAVNDHHIMKLWGEALNGASKIDFLADGSGEFTRALGFEKDMSEGGLGTRCRRFSMIVDDGVVKALNFEPEGGTGITATGAPAMLQQLS